MQMYKINILAYNASKNLLQNDSHTENSLERSSRTGRDKNIKKYDVR